jgi:hypothetical protein
MAVQVTEKKLQGSRGRRQPTQGKGNVRHYRNQTFWAERGMIRCVDERDGEYQTITIAEWLGRAQALSNEAHRTKWADERDDMLQLIEGMVAIAKLAKTQGDPCRPMSAKEQEESLARAKQRLQESERTSIVVPGQIEPDPSKKLILLS